MLEDIRTHEATPTAEERLWLDTDPVIVLFRVAALAVIALAIGLTAVDRGEPRPESTETAQKQEPRT